ncbi:MAG: DUF1465 family protein [Pseudomonadota bacterium]
MPSADTIETMDAALGAFADGKVFERVFAEGMALVEEAANYLDGAGRDDSRDLPREAGLTYASWSMELTTRLMQAASWLVMQKAVKDGDMRREEATAKKYRLTRDGPALDAEAQRGNGLPPRFLDLVERSEALYERICRLDEALYSGAPPAAGSPVSSQLARLQEAAETGAFDPLSVWSKAR